MYQRYFNLSENPFTIAPNPRYFYLSDQHREALAHLQYGLNENGGFILLSGEVGTGKTTAWRCLVENLPTDVDLAIVLNPRINEVELLETICDELGVAYEQGSGIKHLTDLLNRHLLDTYSRRRRTVVIVEEAQNLSIEVLEQLRLLTNLETNESKLLQIILIGQPELLEKIADPKLRQLRQRIIARFHLKPFGIKDVRAYVNHRLSVAGAPPHLFSDAAVRKLAKYSQGIPRLINLICDRALLGCFSEERGHVDAAMIRRAAREVFGTYRPRLKSKPDRETAAKTYDPAPHYRTGNYARPIALVAATVAVVAVAVNFAPLHLPILFSDNNLAGNMVTRSLNPAEINPLAANLVAADEQADNEAIVTDASDRDANSSNTNQRPQNELALQQTDLASQPWQNNLAVASRKQDPYRTLFNLWGIELPEVLEQSPCEYALQHQLDCWHRRGGINSIKRVNRPTMLKMISTEGQLFYAVLTAINDTDRLQLAAADKTIEISEDKLEDVWTGEYTLLWKRPENYRDTIYPGDTDRTVGWVAEQLAGLPDYGPPIKETSSYDYDLETRIRLLQKRCGLFVDGLVGKETLIKINTLVGAPPKLQSSEGCSRLS